jgi:hypothetical protein
MPAAKGSVPWNAGRGKGWTDKRGYQWLYVTENGRRVARRAHRVVMEAHIGRKLDPWELVHHRDGNPANNDIANLEITDWGSHTAEHHTGGRKSEDARRSMEAFALMREQLRREREIKEELLAALMAGPSTLHTPPRGDGQCRCSQCSFVKLRAAAIAKATGETQ